MTNETRRPAPRRLDVISIEDEIGDLDNEIRTMRTRVDFNVCGFSRDELEREKAELESSPGYLALVNKRDLLREQVTRNNRIARLAESGVPKKDLSLIVAGSIDETASIRHLREAGEQGHWFAVLSGPAGCGKSTAASWWLSEQGKGRFISAHQLTRCNRFDADEMNGLESVGALVVDDLGAEYSDAKGAFASLLDGLLNARYSNMRPTTLTTNMTAGAFTEAYGQRLIDRIREAGAWYSCTGKSLRSHDKRPEPIEIDRSFTRSWSPYKPFKGLSR